MSCRWIMHTGLPFRKIAIEGEDGGRGLSNSRTLAVASTSAPANTVATASGFALLYFSASPIAGAGFACCATTNRIDDDQHRLVVCDGFVDLSGRFGLDRAEHGEFLSHRVDEWFRVRHTSLVSLTVR